MRSSKFTEEQIAFALKQAETGTPVKEVIRKIFLQSHFYPE
jgi:putative transposase